jgi:hypothetical protein
MVKMADFWEYAIDGLTVCVNGGGMDKKSALFVGKKL